MMQNKSNYLLTTILFIHILVYFFKIDNDTSALHESFNRPIQACTDEPHLKDVSFSDSSDIDYCQYSESCDVNNNHTQIRIIWNSIFLTYNSRVLHLLKHNESYSVQTIKLISILHRQNTFPKSSEDEDTDYCFSA